MQNFVFFKLNILLCEEMAWLHFLLADATDTLSSCFSSSSPVPSGHCSPTDQIPQEPPWVLHHRLLRHPEKDQETRIQISELGFSHLQQPIRAEAKFN